MKRALYILLGYHLLAFTPVFADEVKWVRHEFDDRVDVTFPSEEVEFAEWMLKNKGIYQKELLKDSADYIAERMAVFKDTSIEGCCNLPYDRESLLEYYAEIAKQFGEKEGEEGLEGEEVSMDGLLGYEFTVGASKGKPYKSSRLLLVEDSLYAFFYSSTVDFQVDEKDKFFSGIIVKEPKKIDQFKGTPPGNSFSFKKIFGQILFLLGLSLALYFYFRNRWNRQKAAGIPPPPPQPPSYGQDEPPPLPPR